MKSIGVKTETEATILMCFYKKEFNLTSRKIYERGHIVLLCTNEGRDDFGFLYSPGKSLPNFWKRSVLRAKNHVCSKAIASETLVNSGTSPSKRMEDNTSEFGVLTTFE